MPRDDAALIARRAARSFALAGATAAAQELAPEASVVGRRALWRLVAFASGALAALAARQLVKLAWTTATGRDKMPDPTDPETPLGIAVGWTISIAVGVLVGRRVGQRLAVAGWERAFNEPPPAASATREA